MTQWNEFVKEFADKKKIAYGCAIVRNDLRKAYKKEYNPVPRNRGIYGTGKMRKSRRPPTEEEAKQSALKREASFKKTRDMKEEQAKKADEERQRKFEAELEAQFKASEEKAKAEKLAKKKAEDEAKAKAEAKAKEDPRIEQERQYRQNPTRENYFKLDRVKDLIKKNKERWDMVANAKDIGSESRVRILDELNKIYMRNSRKDGIDGLFLYVEKEWKDNKKLLTFGGIDLDMERGADKFGYLQKNEDGEVSVKIKDKENRTYKEYIKQNEEIKKRKEESKK